MEIVLVAAIVGFISYVAGRAQVGTNAIATVHAQAIAQEMYDKGRAVGQFEVSTSVRIESDAREAATNAVALLDEYINGYSFAMKAVREHGLQAEEATREHVLKVIRAREAAILANPEHRHVVRLQV